jgi:trk system potassium uptake protein TrkH
LFGTIMGWFSLVFLVPLVVALVQGTPFLPFLLPFGVSLGLGLGAQTLSTGDEIEVEDGFLLVVLCWVSVGFLGGLPYLVSGLGSLSGP